MHERALMAYCFICSRNRLAAKLTPKVCLNAGEIEKTMENGYAGCSTIRKTETGQKT